MSDTQTPTMTDARLVALNAAGDLRAAMILSQPWAIAELISVLREWQETDPQRVVTITRASTPTEGD